MHKFIQKNAGFLRDGTRVAFIHLYNDRSGSPTVLSHVIATARSLDINFHLFTSGHKDGVLSGEREQTTAIFYRRSEQKLVTLAYYIVGQIQLFFSCLRHGMENKECLFYINTFMPFGAALAAKVLNRKTLFHIHETTVNPPILKWFLRFVVSHTATQVIFPSNYLKEVEQFKKVSQLVIHNPVRLPQDIHAKQLNLSSFEILMICSMKRYKGVFHFLDLASKFLDDAKYRFTMVLNATDSEIKAFFEGAVIPSNVTLHSRQSELHKYYLKADLLLNLSPPNQVIESFGLTIVEAMSYGIPVIAPPIGGPAEIVRDLMDGFLINADELENIFTTINAIANDSVRYQLMSNNAIERSKAYDLHEFSKKMELALVTALTIHQ